MSNSDKLEIVNLSNVGRRRPHNEDSTLSDRDMGIAILADGMGGYKAGEVASALAATDIYHEISKGLAQLKPGQKNDGGLAHQSILLRDAIIHANSDIYRTAQDDPECRGMGTTIMAALFRDGQVTIAHVGDSRAYRLRGDNFQQITKDHSLIQELIDRGLYTPEEAAANTPKNLVTRALGIDSRVEVDIGEEVPKPGDIYLLCSDGLNDMVDDEEIHLTLSKYSANLVQAAEKLVNSANTNGGKDNISVILIRVLDGFTKSNGSLKQTYRRFFTKSGV